MKNYQFSVPWQRTLKVVHPYVVLLLTWKKGLVSLHLHVPVTIPGSCGGQSLTISPPVRLRLPLNSKSALEQKGIATKSKAANNDRLTVRIFPALIFQNDSSESL